MKKVPLAQENNDVRSASPSEQSELVRQSGLTAPPVLDELKQIVVVKVVKPEHIADGEKVDVSCKV